MEFYREENPEQIKQSELIVGIPSWREADNIALVTEQVALGLKGFNAKSVIINGDNNSDDNTRGAFWAADSHGIPRIYLSTPLSQQGKGYNLLNIFNKAHMLGARAVAIVEADVSSIHPEWITNLLEPVLAGHDLVTPLYANPRHQALLTNLALYPLLRCLLGWRVQHPNGGERAFSARLLEVLLRGGPWPEIALRAGFDLWSTIIAIRHKLPLCQTYVGGAKVHRNSSQYQADDAFSVTIGMLFQLLAASSDWRNIKWSRPTAFYGFKHKGGNEPLDIAIDQARLRTQYNAGFAVGLEFFARFSNLSSLPEGPEQMDHQRWASLLLSCFWLYCQQPHLLGQILDALQPFFAGWVLFFLQNTSKMNTRQVEEFIETQCLMFEERRLHFFDNAG